ncbi:MAG: hypothetical protein EOP88_17900 [Verrucomicrobiaceae bacterium]|nr:MAG: hypothetical protein EOP88_17900 [Verrucomicrobiaceae bacterium]
MSAAPSEPEKYTIDEMMDRLKNTSSGNPDDGELVTRADGSQAIRVRKRKRRSNQPHKEDAQRSRRSRIVQVSAALVLVFVAAFAVGAAVIYANSSPFRQGLEQKIIASSGADIELLQFRMNPKTANAGNLNLKWPEGNVLESLSMRGLSGEIFPASFLGKSMTGEEVTIQEATLSLRVPSAGEATRATPAAAGISPIRFSHYRFPQFHLILGDPAAPDVRLLKSEASFNPQGVNGRPQLNLYQGQLAIAGWPKLRVDRAFIEFRGDETDIVGMRMLHVTAEDKVDEGGSLEVSGTVSPYKPDQLSTLEVKLKSFELAGITGPALGKLLSGEIDSISSTKSNYLSFYPTGSPSPELDVTFESTAGSGVTVQGLPFLFALSQLLDDEWFANPLFEASAKGFIHREKGIAALRGLDLQSKGRIAIRGGLSLAPNQTLSGTLEVGVAEAMIASAPKNNLGALNVMFGPPKEGFRWLEVDISGPANAPADTFKELYSAASGAARPATAPVRDGGSSFEELTRPK